MDGALPVEELPPDTRALANLLFERITGVGHWKVTIDGENGVVRWLNLEHVRMPAHELDQFNHKG
jgi:hypothetical protein